MTVRRMLSVGLLVMAGGMAQADIIFSPWSPANLSVEPLVSLERPLNENATLLVWGGPAMLLAPSPYYSVLGLEVGPELRYYPLSGPGRFEGLGLSVYSGVAALVGVLDGQTSEPVWGASLGAKMTYKLRFGPWSYEPYISYSWHNITIFNLTLGNRLVWEL